MVGKVGGDRYGSVIFILRFAEYLKGDIYTNE
jgi:hypothetical protein